MVRKLALGAPAYAGCTATAHAVIPPAASGKTLAVEFARSSLL
jgi:hypothetical protein